MAAYPSTFNPNKKVENPKKTGIPEFEPLLKAGGSWTSELTVPDDIRETGASLSNRRAGHDVKSTRDGSAENPENPRQQAKSVTWVIEVTSQILFSNSAAVHFEVLVGRDERSLDLGFAAVAGHGHGTPGTLADYNKDRKRDGLPEKSGDKPRHGHRGVYSKAVKLVVEDTDALWDKPALPRKPKEEDESKARKSKDARTSRDGPKKSKDGSSADGGEEDDDDNDDDDDDAKSTKKKKIHLVVLTHGLHSNIGADMLYLKESIDATVKQARLDARKRKAEMRARKEQISRESAERVKQNAHRDSGTTSEGDTGATAPTTGGQEDLDDGYDDSDDEEETIVRGFTGNAVRTERGIQYLGKRLAKYVLELTYPDQPFLPVKKSMSRSLTDSFKPNSLKHARDGVPSHAGSSVHKDSAPRRKRDLAYTFTSISFVGHSLGGLIQTYAVAYIQKHTPHFFTQIQPINFICLASPLLGLSNENPMYVKFALDFGLVGRTGQDLGLTWRAPTIAKSGWSNLVNGLSSGPSKDKDKVPDPGAKPLLRILPTGPAHTVLRMFRNRTVYANVVNDGIVPLRTSCLLFLDWRGLGKVDKARRENGLLGTMAEWGWAELTGANAMNKSGKYGDVDIGPEAENDEGSGTNTPTRAGQGDDVPQPAREATTNDNCNPTRSASGEVETDRGEFEEQQSSAPSSSAKSGGGLLDSFMNFLRPGTPIRASQSAKITNALRRGQVRSPSPASTQEDHSEQTATSEHDRQSSITRGSTDNPTMRPQASRLLSSTSNKRPAASRGDSDEHEALAPPRTSIFESASDILHPPIPSTSWIIDPNSRSRTIFHDRVYHPEDIPPPPIRRPSRLGRSFSSDSISLRYTGSKDSSSTLVADSNASTDTVSEFGSMKVEEKIARAYHRDLSWRKVLVRLEPDAHNNMIVRRMFANAYGWPVVKHLCDTHFADSWTAQTRDEDETTEDRAADAQKQPNEVNEGEEVKGQTIHDPPPRSKSEMREEQDELRGLHEVGSGIERHRVSIAAGSALSGSSVASSGAWDDIYFEGGSDDEDDMDDSYASRIQRAMGLNGQGYRNSGSGFAGWIGGREDEAAKKQESQDALRTQPAVAPSSTTTTAGSSRESTLSGTPKHMRTSSSSYSVEPLLSPDTATGKFVPLPSPSARISPRITQQLTAEPQAMDEQDESNIEPGDTTPLATTASGSGTDMERMVTAPEVAWNDGKGDNATEIGLRKSVEEKISPPASREGGDVRNINGQGLTRLSIGSVSGTDD